MQHPSDNEIIGFLNSGNPEDLNTGLLWIYQKYGTLMCQAIRKQLWDPRFSEDDVETVFEDILDALMFTESSQHRNLKRFRPEFEGSLGVWLARAAKNKAKDKYKQWILRDVVSSDPIYEDSDYEDDFIDSIADSNSFEFENDVMSSMFYKVALGSIESLPDDKKDVLLLHKLGLTHPEIAKRLGISVSASKKRLERGKEVVRVQMIEEGYGKKDERYSIFPLWWVFRRNNQEHAHQTLYNTPIDNTATNRLGDFIRGKRHEKSLNRNELCQRTGLERAQLTALENGRILKTDIKSEWLDSIGNALKLDPKILQNTLDSKISNPEKRLEEKDVTNKTPPLPRSLKRRGLMPRLAIFALAGWLAFTYQDNIMAIGSDLLLRFEEFTGSVAGESSDEGPEEELPDEVNQYCVVVGGNKHLRRGPGGAEYYGTVGSVAEGSEVKVSGQPSEEFTVLWYLVEGVDLITQEQIIGWIYHESCDFSGDLAAIPTVEPYFPEEIVEIQSPQQIDPVDPPLNPENPSDEPIPIPETWSLQGEFPEDCKFVQPPKGLGFGHYEYSVVHAYITDVGSEIRLYQTIGDTYSYIDKNGRKLTSDKSSEVLFPRLEGQQPDNCYLPTGVSEISLDIGSSSCVQYFLGEFQADKDITWRFRWQPTNPSSAASYEYTLYHIWRLQGGRYYRPTNIDYTEPIGKGIVTEPYVDIRLLIDGTDPLDLWGNTTNLDVYRLSILPISPDGGKYPNVASIEFGRDWGEINFDTILCANGN